MTRETSSSYDNQKQKYFVSYANCLLDLNEEINDKNISYIDELQLVYDHIDDTFYQFLKHPKILPSEKKNVFKTVYFDNHKISQTTLSFLYLLIDNGMICEIGNIINTYHKEMNKRNGILEVEVITSNPLSKEEKDKLQTKLIKYFHKQIILKEVLKSNILGGMIIKYNDKVIDASLIHEQEALKKYLEK